MTTSDAAASAAAAAGSVPLLYCTKASGALALIALSGDDGIQTSHQCAGPGPARLQVGGTAGPWGGTTWPEPPPLNTATSACEPITAIERIVCARNGSA